MFREFQKFIRFLNFFFASKCFIPRREIRSISLGVQLILFPFIGVSKSLEPFKNLKGFSVFFYSKCFIPRREMRSISSRGSIEVCFHLLNFVLGNVYWISKNYKIYRVFLRKNVLLWRVGRSQKVSFNFFHFKIYQTLNIYIYKSCPHKFPMGFKFWSSWRFE